VKKYWRKILTTWKRLPPLIPCQVCNNRWSTSSDSIQALGGGESQISYTAGVTHCNKQEIFEFYYQSCITIKWQSIFTLY
jgi:hypothetical protein